MAYWVSRATECNPSFRIRLARWVSTVRVLMSRRVAISLVESPSATSLSTSRSRSVMGSIRRLPPVVPRTMALSSRCTGGL